jgi:23S rRNA (cytidine1920-2'-O)/16S rRNA (cytidine1409-2'-O)-methyltransferase
LPAENQRKAVLRGRLFYVLALDAEVFNTFVENSVEKGHSIFVSDSVRDASTLCTEAGAGTFVVKPSTKSELKTRLDKLLVNRGLAASRERAQAMILAGKVLVDEQKLEKAGAQVAEDCVIRLLGEDLKYVSRGGVKLERALEHWKIDVKRKICLDVGASTGGFTDCLLQRGAERVIAVDTGYGQMDFKLRQDPRVRLLEKTNARYLTREALGEVVDFIAMDVSFISTTVVLPAVIAAAFPESAVERRGRKIVVLVKPQFEAGREFVGKGGIVRDESVQTEAVEKVRGTLRQLGAAFTDAIESPILGGEGNREFLLHGVFE